MKQIFLAALTLAGLVALETRAQAQTFVRPAPGPYVRPSVSPYYRPAVSPYLNLDRGGNVGVNYYGLVRPQLQFATQIQQLQGQEAETAAQLATGGGPVTVPATGVQAGFMNFSHYYGYRPIGTGGNVRPATLPLAVSPPAIMAPVGPVIQQQQR